MMRLVLLLIFLTFTVNSHAKIITLSNCSTGDSMKYAHKKEMDKNTYEKNEYIININQKLVRRTVIFTDSFIKNENDTFRKEHKKDFNRDKITSFQYRIEYSDSKFVKATTDIRDTKGKHTVEINLNEKTIKSTLETKSNGAVSSFSLYQYCGGSGGSKDFLNKIIGK
jgi:major membrane immunogen (membrane-anchored lipoprotein)